MDWGLVFSIAASATSVCLAIFAVWFAMVQRRESQQAYEHTRKVLAEIDKVLEKTNVAVSENFQNLLQSTTTQQQAMLEQLKPKKTMEDLIIELASDDPAKLTAVAEVVVKVQEAQAQHTPQDPMAALLEHAMKNS